MFLWVGVIMDGLMLFTDPTLRKLTFLIIISIWVTPHVVRVIAMDHYLEINIKNPNESYRYIL